MDRQTKTYELTLHNKSSYEENVYEEKETDELEPAPSHYVCLHVSMYLWSKLL